MAGSSQEVGTRFKVLGESQMTLGQINEAAVAQLAQVPHQRLEGPAGRLRGRTRSKGALPAFNPLKNFGVALVHGCFACANRRKHKRPPAREGWVYTPRSAPVRCCRPS
jgi:hypothetical protein